MNRTLLASAILLGAAITALGAVRVKINLGVGHPIARPGRTVIVRPMRSNVVVRERLVYAAPVVWTRTVIAAPPRERLQWEDSEVIRREEEWVDNRLGVHNRGNRLLVRIDGRATIDFAEVHFGNGQVQVVDFKEGPMENGTYTLLDFADGRMVEHVRLVARSRARESRISLLMVK